VVSAQNQSSVRQLRAHQSLDTAYGPVSPRLATVLAPSLRSACGPGAPDSSTLGAGVVLTEHFPAKGSAASPLRSASVVRGQLHQKEIRCCRRNTR
jgi:hypothetical protein